MSSATDYVVLCDTCGRLEASYDLVYYGEPEETEYSEYCCDRCYNERVEELELQFGTVMVIVTLGLAN